MIGATHVAARSVTTIDYQLDQATDDISDIEGLGHAQSWSVNYEST